jgi:hypothetical protein
LGRPLKDWAGAIRARGRRARRDRSNPRWLEEPQPIDRERGYDIEEVDAAIAADRAREERLGLSFDNAAQAQAKETTDA